MTEKDYWLEDAADKLRKLDLPQHATHVENAARRMRRLRHTLQLISLGSQNSGTSKEDLGREARMALGETPE